MLMTTYSKNLQKNLTTSEKSAEKPKKEPAREKRVTREEGEEQIGKSGLAKRAQMRRRDVSPKRATEKILGGEAKSHNSPTKPFQDENKRCFNLR